MLKRKIYCAILVLQALLISSCSSEGGATSCPKVKNGNFSPAPTYINLSFEPTSDANSYKIEYGLTGYTPGTGTSTTTSNSNVTIQNLTSSTTYDFYITSICDSDNSSEPYKISSVTTTPSECTGTVTAYLSQFSSNYISVDLYYGGSSPERYDVEYGLNGFTLGTGTKISTTPSQTSLDLSGIQNDTNYDIYVRAVCYGNDPSPYVKYDYLSMSSCPAPFNLSSYNMSGACNTGLGETRAFSWSYNSTPPTSYTICIVEGTNLPSITGNVFVTSNNSIALSGMYCLWDAFYVRANCTDGSSSQWAGPFYW